MKGGVIVDLFVCPQHRSRGVAVLLAINLAKQIQECGGTHLKGGAVNSPIAGRLYHRIAMKLSDNEYYVSGRAFRHLASLSGKSLREIVRILPENGVELRTVSGIITPSLGVSLFRRKVVYEDLTIGRKIREAVNFNYIENLISPKAPGIWKFGVSVLVGRHAR